MENKIMIAIGSTLLAVSVLGFNNYQQVPEPNILAHERADQKATFDYHQRVYNNKANTQIRAEKLVAKEEKTDKQENLKIEETQDKTKGQILMKF